MTVDRVVLRRFEKQLGREIALSDGRKATVRVVDACGGRLSFCVELPEGRLVWIGPEQFRILDEPGRSRGGAA